MPIQTRSALYGTKLSCRKRLTMITPVLSCLFSRVDLVLNKCASVLAAKCGTAPRRFFIVFWKTIRPALDRSFCGDRCKLSTSIAELWNFDISAPTVIALLKQSNSVVLAALLLCAKLVKTQQLRCAGHAQNSCATFATRLVILQNIRTSATKARL